MNIKNLLSGVLVMFLLLVSACSKTPEIDNTTMLDGETIFDPSLYDPAKFLVSAAISNPTTAQKNMPVIIAGHGYSASTFEWDEFQAYCKTKGDVLVSQVLLGGHGRTYEEFKKSTWEEWQTPLMTEYNALRAKGYTNISFAGTSTSCPLLLDLVKKGSITNNGAKHIFLIDPIVVPSDKMLTLVGLIGPMLGYVESSLTPMEEGKYYHFRPQETLKQLMNLIDKTRKDLQKGYHLPTGVQLKLYKSKKDPTADAVSAVLIDKGLKTSDGTDIDIEMLDSDLHVVTRLAGRENIQQKDKDMQLHVFDDMYKLVKQ
jgi:carboxylesterase